MSQEAYSCQDDTEFGQGGLESRAIKFGPISRGGVFAHCRGFGTCGWTDVGGTSTRTKIVGPTALAARPTL